MSSCKPWWIASLVPSDQVRGCSLLCFSSQQQRSALSLCSYSFGALRALTLFAQSSQWCVLKVGLKSSPLTHLNPFCFLFQPRMMVSGRTAFPTSVALCCSKPSITCWSAASWIAALFASASGSSNPTRSTRSPSTRGMLEHFVLCWSCSHLLLFARVSYVWLWCGLTQRRDLSSIPPEAQSYSLTHLVKLTLLM